jgi:NAD-dependent deacetylase
MRVYKSGGKCVPPQEDELSVIVNSSKNIVFFVVVGVSTESDIPDFRSAAGLYKQAGTKLPPEQMLHRDFFFKYSQAFYEYYFTHMIYPDAKPNAAHISLAELENEGRLKAVVTQNIDGLHQMAGSKNVYELHGSVNRNFCTNCGAAYTLADIISTQPAPPRCAACGGLVKPDVVLYGENLQSETVERAVEAITLADVLIVGGTSLSVYPAAGFVRYYRGNSLILINREPTPYDGLARLLLRGKIGEILGHLHK